MMIFRRHPRSPGPKAAQRRAGGSCRRGRAHRQGPRRWHRRRRPGARTPRRAVPPGGRWPAPPPGAAACPPPSRGGAPAPAGHSPGTPPPPGVPPRPPATTASPRRPGPPRACARPRPRPGPRRRGPPRRTGGHRERPPGRLRRAGCRARAPRPAAAGRAGTNGPGGRGLPAPAMGRGHFPAAAGWLPRPGQAEPGHRGDAALRRAPVARSARPALLPVPRNEPILATTASGGGRRVAAACSLSPRSALPAARLRRNYRHRHLSLPTVMGYGLVCAGAPTEPICPRGGDTAVRLPA
jgi:translation initiation factor IF-2